tara:strand:+ start:338 stop:1384 length:1047 start_codon:yes stop_codon:yes gene_type:complete
MAIDINYRKIEQSDLSLLHNWYNSFLFNTYFKHKVRVKKSIFLSKAKKFINKHNLEIIMIDNIRVGARIKKNVLFLNPIYYIFQYLKLNYLIQNKILDNKFKVRKILNAYSNSYKDFELKNINIVKDRKKNPNLKKYQKILILGPSKRNKVIYNFLKKEGNEVIVYSKKIKLDHKLLKSIDLIISNGYAHLINKDIINKFRNHIINLHATFLPWGKGIGTILHSSLLNEPTGISFHLIDKNFDTGKIIYRKILNAERNDTTRTFYNKLMIEINTNFIRNWESIKSNDFKTYDQKQFCKKIDTPYFSRLEFESLIEKLPDGYDTKLFDLAVMGYICRNNRIFFNNLLNR